MAHLDNIIVCIFLLTTLVVGVLAGRGIKTIQEYAIANQMYSSVVLVITYLATDIGAGSVFSDAATVFRNGIIVNISIASLSIAFIIRAIFIAPNMVYFRDCLTMGEVIGVLYGQWARVITGILSFFNAILLTGIQFIALGIISESFLGISAIWGVAIGGCIMAIYTAIGGIKAVTITDIMQFFVLIIAIPLIACIIIQHVGGIQALFLKVPPEKLMILGHEKFYRYSIYFMIWLLQLGMIDPAIIQRMLMAKNKQQLRNQYLTIALFDPCFRFIVMLIGLSGVVLYPSIEAKNVVSHVIQNLLPVGVKGIAIAGLLAVVMSSADSYLHAAGLTLIHDVISPLYKQKTNALNELCWVKFAIVIAGSIAVFLGIQVVHISYLGFKALEVIAPMLLFPFVAGVIGLKPNKQAFFWSVLITLLAFVTANLLLPAAYEKLSLIIGTVVNGFVFLGTHYRVYGGFKRADRPVIKPLTDSQFSNKYSFFSAFKRYDLTPKKVLYYFAIKVATYDTLYIFSGILCCFNLFVPYLIAQQFPGERQTLFFTLLFIGTILAFLLIIKDKWEHLVLKKHVSVFFYITLCYCLPFSSTIMVMATQGDIFWFMHLFCSIMILMVLLSWRNTVFLTSVGMVSGWLCIGYLCPLIWHFHTTTYTLVGYQAVICLLIGFIIMFRKEQLVDQLEAQKQQLLRMHTLNESDCLYSIQHQMFQQKVLLEQDKPLQDIKKTFNRLVKKFPQNSHTFQKTIEQLNSFIMCYKNNFYDSVGYLRLNIDQVQINSLLTKLATLFKALGFEKKIQIQLNTQQAHIYCDSDWIVQLLINGFCQFQPEKIQTPLLLSIQDTMLKYEFDSLPDKGYTRILPALSFTLTTETHPFLLQTIYPGNIREAEIHIPNNTDDLIEFKSKRILDAHYGYSETTTLDANKQVLYVIPVDLHAIRSKIADKDVATETCLLETEDSIAVEEKLLAQLKEKNTVNLKTIQKVIVHIKQLHRGQFRKSGELFYTHPLAVTSILLRMTQAQDTIIAALLHDTVEDTSLTLDQIAYHYGQTVASIVSNVTDLDSTRKKTKLTKLEIHQKFLACHDPNVIMIKIADRLHNLHTLIFHSPNKQKHIVLETLAFYIPLGRKLNIDVVNQVIDEMENCCQDFLPPR